jgi:rhodanese-related sulfurtransferase
MIRLSALILGLSLVSCAAAPADRSNLPPAQADSLIRAQTGKKEFHLVDVRTPEEFGAGHLQGATPMDFYAPDFKAKLATLPRDGKILIYCRSGHRSGLALQAMKELGFTDASDIAGGINAWRGQGLPVVP